MSSTAGNVEIMTIREVADYLKVTERTIYRLLSANWWPTLANTFTPATRCFNRRFTRHVAGGSGNALQ